MTAALNSKSHTDRRSGWLLFALALSLLFHLTLLRVTISPQESSEPADDLVVSIRSVQTEPSRHAARASELPEIIDPPERSQESAPASDPLPGTRADPSESVTDDDDPSDSNPGGITRSSEAPMMTTRLLSSVRENLGRPTLPERSDITAPAGIPALPNAPGWIDQFVGDVDGRVEYWDNGDGSIESRIVTANGQIFCGRTRAPSTADLFNPQFATNIMLFRACGKERPAAPDSSDPRVRIPRSSP